MAFKMRGLPQYGDEGPKQLSNFARRIFGNKEQRQREKKYFQAKKEIRKGLKGSGSVLIKDGEVIAGGVDGVDNVRAGTNVKNLYSGGRKALKDAANKIADGHFESSTMVNDKGQTVTTSKEQAIAVGNKKKRKITGNDAVAHADAKDLKGPGISVDADIDATVGPRTKVIKPVARKEISKITTYTPSKSETIPGVEKTETFDNEEDFNKRNQELLNLGFGKVEAKVGMNSGMGYQMKSNIMALAASEGTGMAKIMQMTNPNPINTSQENVTVDYGSGTRTNVSQENYEVPATEKYEGPKLPKGSKEEADWAKQRDYCKGKPPGTPGCSGFHKYEGGGSAPGMDDKSFKGELSYMTPDETKVTPASTETSSSSSSDDLTKTKNRGLKVSVDADVDAKVKGPKIKLPKIGKIVGDFVDKTKEKIKKKKTERNVRKGNCPPCPPCN